MIYLSLFISDPNEHLVVVFRELDRLTDWKSLGLYLGLHISTLDEIQADEPDTHHRKMAMLHLWLSLTDGVKDNGGATKAALVEALRKADENALADTIETKRLTSFQSPPPSRELYTKHAHHSISNSISTLKIVIDTQL